MNPVRPLTPEEYAALKSSIGRDGLIQPIVLDSGTGDVVDGHHRLRACEELGVEPKFERRKFASEAQREDLAIVLNVARRQVGPLERARLAERLAELRGVRLGPGRRSGKAAPVAALASDLGVSERTLRQNLQLRRELAEHPDLAEKVDAGEMPSKRALREVRERASRRRASEAATAYVRARRVEVFHCSCAELRERVEPSSVDLIFTDPPYASPSEHLPAWEELAEFAEYALRPGALLVAYTGSLHTPDFCDPLRARLRFVTFGMIYVPGPNSRNHHLRVAFGSKPLVFFTRLDSPPGASWPWFSNTFVLSDRDVSARERHLHPWQQALGPALHYIEALTRPGDLVCDPFLGSGTFAVAAHRLGRRFVGCDVDAGHLETAKGALVLATEQREAA